MKKNVVTFLLLIGGLALSHCAVSIYPSDARKTNRTTELQEEISGLQLKNSKLRSKTGNSSLIETFAIEFEEAIPKNCAEVTKSGVYNIRIPPYKVYCNAITQGGRWTVVQRRVDGSVDFYLPWVNYTKGFGNLRGEFFVGLENLHLMTTYEPQELMIVMEDFEKQTRYASYKLFVVGNENQMYSLQQLGTFSGDAGDSLTNFESMKFSTYDNDNDEHPDNCAQKFKGAWWYKACHASNLNGLYLGGAYAEELYAQGVVWHSWLGHYYSLKTVEMMIRPLAK